MNLTGPTSRQQALAIYLQDHQAGAQAGLALAHRAAREQSGRPAGRVLAHIAADIEEDEAVLRRVMEQVGARPSPVKGLGARVAEALGRLKANGQLLGRSPLSPLLELEALLSAVKSKQHVWLLLRDVLDRPVMGVDPQRMIERADDQLERLHALWLDAARAALPARDLPPVT